jgi:AICARFT/IMPCHase bienzyme
VHMPEQEVQIVCLHSVTLFLYLMYVMQIQHVWSREKYLTEWSHQDIQMKHWKS